MLLAESMGNAGKLYGSWRVLVVGAQLAVLWNLYAIWILASMVTHLPMWKVAQNYNDFKGILSMKIDVSFIDICSLGYDWWECIIGLDNGSAPNCRKAII